VGSTDIAEFPFQLLKFRSREADLTCTAAQTLFLCRVRHAVLDGTNKQSIRCVLHYSFRPYPEDNVCLGAGQIMVVDHHVGGMNSAVHFGTTGFLVIREVQDKVGLSAKLQKQWQELGDSV
jgi:hypothetical protein